MKDNASTKNILVLCAGYPYKSDTAFGSHVAKALEKNGLPEYAECLDVGESISEISHLIGSRDKIIIVDILETKDAPGTVYRLRPEEIFDATDGTVDAAKYHILQTIYELEVTGDCKDAVFIGIVPEDTETPGETPTEQIAGRIPAVVDMIMEEIFDRY